ncbi:serine hydrolase [Scopulibacillus darangshiensis]|uniref:serine hydrolase n=1 Tax=Scopulibacillus darangshiensis TaxID=442528 RepID=UPI001053348A
MNLKKRLRQSAVFCLIFFLTIAAIIQSPKSASADTNTDDLNVKAKSAILVDADTGQILYNKKSDEMLPPASMTKMMTEYLTMKAIHSGKISWDTKVNISDYVYTISQNREFSNVPLRKDYQYTVKDLYEAMAIYSANGATIALAEKIGGSEKNFVKLMNKTAKKLGMKNAKYINSSGLSNKDLGKFASVGGPNDSNLLSARAIAKLAYNIVNDYPDALKIASTPIKMFTAGVDNPIKMVNWNWMLPGFGANMHQYTYEGVDGLKTGHTDLAGYCFTGTAERNGHRLITVVMGTDSEGDRFNETRKLLDYGFNQFSFKTVMDKGQTVKGHKTLPVTKGKEDKVKIAVKDSLKLALKNGEEKGYKPVLHLDKSKLNEDGKLEAPVKKGEKVGYVTLSSKNGKGYSYLNGQDVKVPVVTTEGVDKANWFILSMRATGHFISGVFSSAADMVKGWF